MCALMLRRYNNAEPNVLNDVDDFIQSKNDEDREHFMVLRRDWRYKMSVSGLRTHLDCQSCGVADTEDLLPQVLDGPQDRTVRRRTGRDFARPH